MASTAEQRSRSPQRVLVTGAAGKLGSVVTARLAESGVDVVAVDRVAPGDGGRPGVSYIVADLTDPAAVRQAVAGCDGVVHLAKYSGYSDEAQFSVNTSAAYNVLAAAADAGIEHAVIASSVCAYGMTFTRRPFSPHYAPVDEDHPLLPQGSYSLSKVVDEITGRSFADAFDMSVVALRFHWLAELDEVRTAAARLAAHPEPPHSKDLWSYTEVTDAARACELALEVPTGFHALNICAADTLSTVPTMELLARHHPDTEIRGRIEGTDSPWAMNRAREILGFVPQRTWRTAAAGAGGTDAPTPAIER
ncbi:MAG TPA: NAD(P)-dependent oxidoreductase [Kribbella sp.]|uniref:NAD-dependent epimerase/dehydratase family protein n=1 Tax=Kribbella sp. TaxID=1871183 RepID=UPI002D773B43|nr:NAD(P)-dependent oxidoreductase [Kribbella sp.]HET6299830.1 NAD(P)-dependent oxidoreductase [Kribbella sp.]